MIKPRLLYVALAVYGLLSFITMTEQGRSGHVGWPVLAIWFASPILMYGLRRGLEGNQPKFFVSVKASSWSYLFGDSIILPYSAFVLALGWRKIDVTNQWFTSWWWGPLTMFVGLAAGVWFHWYDGKKNYVDRGLAKALKSPSKLAHDFVAYPVILGGLLHLAVPVFTEGESRVFGLYALIGVGLWVIAAIRDDSADLDYSKFHPQWDEHEFRSLA